MKTTPLVIEIMMHYHVSGGPFPRTSPHIEEIHSALAADEILIWDPTSNRFHGNDPALRAYVEALCAVPWPEKTEVWVVPHG